LNLTNNGWFGEGAAQWQHAANAVFRAVENGVPLVRCTNNGLTCWIDAVGRMRQVLRAEVDDEYGPGFLVVELPLGTVDGTRVGTYYQRHGDVFGWGCVFLALGAGVWRRRRSE
jgi:apolipoprotein N-acyltransferase